MQRKITEARQGLNKISHLVNPTKKRKNSHYTPVLLGNINGRLGKAKFHSLIIILDSGVELLDITRKTYKQLRNKNTHPVKWSTQDIEFLKTHTTNIEFFVLL